MAIRNIRKNGDEILRVKCKPVREINDGVRRLVEDMFETMYAADGVGLAAPQIGIVRQIVVIDDREGGKFALINPVITKEEGEQESCEGCLSLPGYRGTVKRPQKVAVEALDTDGNKVALEAESYLAVILCHEIDHLSGILSKDKALVYEKIPETEEGGQAAHFHGNAGICRSLPGNADKESYGIFRRLRRYKAGYAKGANIPDDAASR